jgi:putative transposase
MPQALARFYGTRDLHFITCSCYHRQSILGTPARRDLFMSILEQTRVRCRVIVLGYVVMPEHFHMLIAEPDICSPATVMQVLKQGFTHALHRLDPAVGHVWQERFYDFNVWSHKKEVEKLRYIHRNPVVRGLVREPDEREWSSFRWYSCREPSPVRINTQEWQCQIRRTVAGSWGSG